MLKKAFLSALALLLLSACSEQKQAIKQEIPALPVEVIVVKKEKLPIWVQYTGTTKASSDQEVRARVSGRLEEIYFHDGDHVEKGQKLFKIEQTQYRANLNAALATKERDKASLALAKADVNRYKPLVKEGLAPRATLEQYEAKQGELKAQILADDAEIDNARLQLSYTIVKAPVSGTTSARRVDVGNIVGYTDSTILTKIVSTDPLYAYFGPSESDMQRIAKFRSKEKLDAFIEVRGSGEEILKRKRLTGFIDFSDNTVDPLTSTVTMRATISNPQSSLLPGTFVYVNIFVTDQYSFLMVPPQIIFEDQRGKYLYVATKENTVKKTYVKTGFSSKWYINIEEGLSSEDKIVISGLVKLRDGMKIKETDVTKDKGIKAVLKNNNLIPEKI